MSEMFDTIGQKAEQLAPVPVSNGENGTQAGEDDDQRVVDEIESLCMNCHENVSCLHDNEVAIPSNLDPQRSVH